VCMVGTLEFVLRDLPVDSALLTQSHFSPHELFRRIRKVLRMNELELLTFTMNGSLKKNGEAFWIIQKPVEFNIGLWIEAESFACFNFNGVAGVP